MRIVTLSKTEQEQLEQTYHTTQDLRLKTRCQVILMVARGRKREQIAQDVGTSFRSVTRWVKAYQDGGVLGLKITWPPGNQALIPKELSSTIIEWVKQGPEGCGLNRANWTYAELADYLYQTHGIRVSRRTMCNFCHAHQIRPYRPTYRYLRAHPEKQKQAQAELSALKKSGPGRSLRTPQSG